MISSFAIAIAFLLMPQAVLNATEPSSECITSIRHVVPTRPNIVILYADDMGFGDLGAQNPNSGIPTPHLDHLAGQGTRFTDAHSSSGVCTPSRYALLVKI